jgi:hypothetical protein
MNPTPINRKELIKKFQLTHPQKNALDNDNGVKGYKGPLDPNIIKSNTIKLYDDTLSDNIKAVLPFIENNKEFEKKNKLKNYSYKLDGILDKKLLFNSNKLVHICAFNIIESAQVDPIILYLLNKDINTNTLYFPHFTTSENIFNKANEYVIEMFKEMEKPATYKGYIETNHNIYIFYEHSHKYLLEKLEYKSLWWWASISEIINNKKILNFSIDRTVYSIFYKQPLLTCLFKNNIKLEQPTIGYFGGHKSYISFIAALGLPKQSPMANLGPYYYFYTYYGAGRGAIWTPSRKERFIEDKKITVNEYGVHDHGGIVRFAIFGDKMKYFLNRDTDDDDTSQISQEAQKTSQFIKSAIKIRDVNGKWAEDHNMAYIGNVLIKSDKYKDRKLTIQFAVRDYYQQLALSYHYVDTSTFSKVSDDEAYNLPFDFTDYNIE